jgi:NAD(P)-dependent dehydrogenase (short-subunit alcohol dehydrogenase family)
MAIPFRHALVTGGGTGIGRAIAIALAEAGVEVTICGRRVEALEEVATASPRIHAIAADVTDEDSVAALYRQATEARGDFDIVIANAGMAASAPAHKTSLDLWQQILDVNLTGVFLTVRPALESMRRAGRGRILFIASVAGLKGAPYISAYVASKHGVVGLARALAAEFASTTITVNAVCPGYVETPMLERTVANIVEKTGRDEAAARAAVAGDNPQGRIIEADEVADTVMWLCGEGARSVTGQAIALSGGEA